MDELTAKQEDDVLEEARERGVPFETLCKKGKDRIGDIEKLEGVKNVKD